MFVSEFVTCTLAPTTIALVWSVITPDTVAVSTCAKLAELKIRMIPSKRSDRYLSPKRRQNSPLYCSLWQIKIILIPLSVIADEEKKTFREAEENTTDKVSF